VSSQAPQPIIDVAIGKDGIATCTINRPNRRNALTREARLHLAQLISDFGHQQDVRAIILASGQQAFSSGQDLSEAKDFPPEYISTWIDEHMSLYRAILSCPRPILAAIDGCCVGAGLQMALLCDLRIGSSDSYFAMPELDDAIPCILGVWTLWDVIGRARTTEMVLTNRQIKAPEALAWGLINEMVPPAEVKPRCHELAEHLAAKPALALRLTKERLRMLMLQEEEALAIHASYAHTVAFSSGQPREAMQVFLDGRRCQKK
jgi:enoyl-CoA hydratase/carnithine racemase